MNGNFHMIVEQPWDGVFFSTFWDKIKRSKWGDRRWTVRPSRPMRRVFRKRSRSQKCSRKTAPSSKAFYFWRSWESPFWGLEMNQMKQLNVKHDVLRHHKVTIVLPLKPLDPGLYFWHAIRFPAFRKERSFITLQRCFHFCLNRQ